ncbi:hypothetical protein PG988_007473 [Apiospora saccharicola]
MAKESKTSGLTARELELASLVWGCFEMEPKIDMAKFTKAAGFGNIASARACWGPVKKKLIAHAHACAKNKEDGENGSAEDKIAVATPKSKASTKKTATANTSTKRKRQTKSAAVVDKEDDTDDAESQETPSKKAKKTDVKAEEFKEESGFEEV